MNKTDKKRYFINIAVIIIMAFLSFIYLTKSELITIESVKEVKSYNYLLVIAYYLIAVLLISLVDFITYRSFTKSFTMPKSVINTLSGQLGSAITPFRSGHFPLMIYYQHESGIKTDDTAVGLVKSQIIYSLSSIIIYLVIVVTLAINQLSIEFYGYNVKLWYVILLGLIFHLIVFCIITILAFNKALQFKILQLISSVLSRVKRDFDESKFLCKNSEKLEIYRLQLGTIINGPTKSILPVLIYMIHMVINGSVCYISFLLVSSVPFSINSLFLFYILYLATNYIANIIPLPGGAGTTEVIFSLVFINLMNNDNLSKTLILFRVSTYYIFIIIDLIVFAIISLKNTHKKIKNRE